VERNQKEQPLRKERVRCDEKKGKLRENASKGGGGLLWRQTRNRNEKKGGATGLRTAKTIIGMVRKVIRCTYLPRRGVRRRKELFWLLEEEGKKKRSRLWKRNTVFLSAGRTNQKRLLLASNRGKMNIEKEEKISRHRRGVSLQSKEKERTPREKGKCSQRNKKGVIRDRGECA